MSTQAGKLLYIPVEHLASIYKGYHVSLQLIEDDGVTAYVAQITGEVRDGAMEVIVLKEDDE